MNNLKITAIALITLSSSVMANTNQTLITDYCAEYKVEVDTDSAREHLVLDKYDKNTKTITPEVLGAYYKKSTAEKLVSNQKKWLPDSEFETLRLHRVTEDGAREILTTFTPEPHPGLKKLISKINNCQKTTPTKAQ